jgi:hypothetical protein
MSVVTKGYTFSAGAVIVASEHNSNFDTLYNDYNGNITNANFSASAGIVDTKLAQITTANKVASSALVNCFPQRATLWHDRATKITGNAFVNAVDTAKRYNTKTYQNTAANGDSFSNSFDLKAGTYTFYVLGYTTTTAGKIDWYVDGVKVVSLQDWYSDPAVENVVKSTASVIVTGDGYHQLIGTVNGKTGSDYFIILTKYWFAPSTDPARA